MASLTVLVTLAAVESFARVVVPEETFWPVGNVFRTVATPGLNYTFKPEFSGFVFGARLETNSQGFRGPEWPLEKAESRLRIALIGDSYAFGYGVPYERTVGEQLARILDRRFESWSHEVINFGVPGYNSRQELAVLRHLALRYDPDLVVVMPVSNDHKRAMAADADGWLHWDGRADNDGSRRVDEWKKYLATKSAPWWVVNSRFLLYARLSWKRWQSRQEYRVEFEAKPGDTGWHAAIRSGGAANRPVAKPLRSTVYEPLLEMIRLLERHSTPVLVACASGRPDYRYMLDRLEYETGAPTLNLFGLFPDVDSFAEWRIRYSLGWDDHPNALSHRRFAEGLAALIELHGMHPEPPTAPAGGS